MIVEKKQRLLIDMYERLVSWPGQATPEQDFDLGPLVHHCLGIISVMCEHDVHVSQVAKCLMFITKNYHHKSLHENMRENFKQAEANMPANLRGFSSLFDLITQENSLRVDTQDLVQRLPAKYQPIASTFQELIHQFDVYDELNLLCESRSLQVLAVLFLRAMNKILEIKMFPENALLYWLNSWCSDDQIISMFSEGFNYENLSNMHDQNKLILFLCLCSADNVVLGNESAEQLERALEQANFPELKFFIEGGFVAVRADQTSSGYGNDFVAKNLSVV